MRTKISGLVLEIMALSLFLIIVFAVTWPAVLNPGKAIIGGNFSFGHLWSWDLLINGILEEGRLITHTNMVGYPQGGHLTLIGWSYILPLVLLRYLGVELLMGVNYLVFVHLLFGFYFAYRLAKLLTNRWFPSLVGGVVYGMSAYGLSLLWNGQYPKLNYGLLPLLLILMIKLEQSRKWWPLVAIGLTQALLVATSPYNGVFGALVLLITGVYLLVRRWKKRRLLVIRLALAAFFSVAAALPFLMYFGSPTSEENLLRPAIGVEMPGDNVNPSDLLDCATLTGSVIGGKAFIQENTRAAEWTFLHVHYLGLLTVLLALLALVFFRRRDDDGEEQMLGPRFFLLLGAIFYVLALGYTLRISPSATRFFDYRIGMPLYWLYKICPGILVISLPYRAIIGVMLGLAMLSSFGMMELTRRTGAIIGAVVCLFAIGGLAADVTFLSPVPLPIPLRSVGIPQVYRDLAVVQDGGAVFDAPNDAHGLMESSNEYFLYYQIHHRHPVAINEWCRVELPMYQTRFHKELASWMSGKWPKKPEVANRFDTFPFCYFVLHENMLDQRFVENVTSFLDNYLELVKIYPIEKKKLYRMPDFPEGGVEIGSPYRVYRAPSLPSECADKDVFLAEIERNRVREMESP